MERRYKPMIDKPILSPLALAGLAALALFASPLAAQVTAPSNPPPASGGFSLENLGRSNEPSRQPQVQGPVDPEAPIATRPTTRQRQAAPRTATPNAAPTIAVPTARQAQTTLNRTRDQTRNPTLAARQAAARQTTARAQAQRGLTQGTPAATGPVGGNAPSASPAAASPTQASAVPGTAAAAQTRVDPLGDAPIVNSASDQDGGFPWAWLLAAIAVIGGAVYFLRQRGSSWAPAVGVPLFERKASEREPAQPQPVDHRDIATDATVPVTEPLPVAPPATAPTPEPVAALPPAQTGEGIEITFLPDYATATFMRVAMRYALVVRNPGSRAVKDIVVRAAMIPASADQDREVAQFHADPAGAVLHRIASIPAGGSVEVEGELALPLAETRPVAYGQRLLFVPLAVFAIGFVRNAKARNLALAYMVGVGGAGDGDGNGGKMGPLRLDLAPKTYNDVAQRPLAFATAA